MANHQNGIQLCFLAEQLPTQKQFACDYKPKSKKDREKANIQHTLSSGHTFSYMKNTTTQWNQEFQVL